MGKVIVIFVFILLLFPIVSAQQDVQIQEPLQLGEDEQTAINPPNIFQQILNRLTAMVNIFSLMLVELDEISEKNTTVILNFPVEECEPEEYNFEESLDLTASQGVVGSGAVLERYYDFETTNEVINGIFNLTNFEGNPTLTTEDALIGNSGRVSINNNWMLIGDEDTNLGSGPEKSVNLWVRGENIGIVQFQTFLHKAPGLVSTLTIGAQDERFYFVNVVGGSNSQGTMNNLQWYMVTVVRDGVQAFIYVDGQLEETDFSFLTDSTEDYFVGVEAGGIRELVGLIDELSWWSNALTQEDIVFLYNSGLGRLATDLNILKGDSEDSQTILIPKEFEYGNFSVLDAVIEGTCVGSCSYRVNGIECGSFQEGFNEIPQECLESFVGGFNEVEFMVGKSSNGGLSNLLLNSLVKPANC